MRRINIKHIEKQEASAEESVVKPTRKEIRLDKRAERRANKRFAGVDNRNKWYKIDKNQIIPAVLQIISYVARLKNTSSKTLSIIAIVGMLANWFIPTSTKQNVDNPTIEVQDIQEQLNNNDTISIFK